MTIDDVRENFWAITHRRLRCNPAAENVGPIADGRTAGTDN